VGLPAVVVKPLAEELLRYPGELVADAKIT
jgi:hypothetical protein